MTEQNTTAETRAFLMSRARGKTECKDNTFFISHETGEIIASVYLQGNGDYASNIPKNTYEINVSKEIFLSYKELDERILIAQQNTQEPESVLHDGKVQYWTRGLMAGIIPSSEAQAMVNEGKYRIINSQAIEWVGGA